MVRNHKDEITYQVGRIIGNLGAGVSGVFISAAGAAGGALTAPTGVGAVAGAGVFVYGATVTASGITKVVENTVSLFANVGNSDGRQPIVYAKNVSRTRLGGHMPPWYPPTQGSSVPLNPLGSLYHCVVY